MSRRSSRRGGPPVELVALPSESEGEEEEAVFEDSEEEEEEEFQDGGSDDMSEDGEDDENEGEDAGQVIANALDEEDSGEDSDFEVSDATSSKAMETQPSATGTVALTTERASTSTSVSDMLQDDDPPVISSLRPSTSTYPRSFSLFEEKEDVSTDADQLTREDLLQPFMGDANVLPLTNDEAWMAATTPTFDASRFRKPYILHDAAESGNLHLLQQIFARNPVTGESLPIRDLRIDQRDLDGCNPLQVALLNGNLQCAKLLIDNGAEISYRCEGSSLAHLVLAMGAYAQYRAHFVLDAFMLLLERGADINLTDDLGRTPLHLAAQLDLVDCMSAMLATRTIAPLTSSVDTVPGTNSNGRGSVLKSLNAIDKDGNTAVHYAAASHCLASLRVLLDASPNTFTNANIFGWTPLHAACYSAAVRYPGVPEGELVARSPVIALLKNEAGLSFTDTDRLGRTPMAWYQRNQGTKTASSNQQQYPPTLIVWSKECLLHLTAPTINRRRSPPPPENVRRLRVLFDPRGGCLRLDELGTGDPNREAAAAAATTKVVGTPAPGVRVPILSGALSVEWLACARRAAIVDVLRCHEYTYVNWLRSKADALQITAAEALNAARIAGNPMAQLQGPSNSFALSGDSAPKGIPSPLAMLDGDTVVSPASYPASLAAAGLVCEAVDRVVQGYNRAAFCAVRPPGHHAGPTGVVHADLERTGSSHGFCLINNVAIGAAYARCVHRHQGIRRVAIIDFDVHHGNGTEAIVRNLAPNTVIQRYQGDLDEAIMVRKQNYKPWLDETDPEEVLFASVHGLKGIDGEWIYPGSGPTSDGIVEAVDMRAVEPEALPSNLGVDDSQSRTGWDINNDGIEDVTSSSAGSYSTYRPAGFIRPRPVPGMKGHILNVGMPANRPVSRWRQAWRHAILPAILKHKPDIIFISAGFDAHKRDSINLGHVGVDESDFYWLTKQLVKVANTVSNGRIISVLEGGYRIQGKVISPFGRSVAAHVRALSEGCGETWDAEASKLERDLEDEEMARLASLKRLELEQQYLAESGGNMATMMYADQPQSSVNVMGTGTENPLTVGTSAPSTAVELPTTASSETGTELGSRRARRNKEPVDYLAFAAEFEERCKRNKLQAEAAAAAGTTTEQTSSRPSAE